jgi:hypothetical protein
MATVSITIPDTILPRVVAAMRSGFPQYAALTDQQCFKQVTADYWKTLVVNYETYQAQQNQQATTTTDVAGIG